MPTKEEKILGGHCVMAVGFDESKQSFIIRNSWGDNWGLYGYFYMPYAFVMGSPKQNPEIESYASDFWLIEVDD